MTSRAIRILRQEHKQIARRLDLLEGQLDLIELGLEPDSGLLVEIANFFRTYPDLFHHPKEELILARLAAVAPAAAGDFSALTSEHEDFQLELVRLSRALVAVLMDRDVAWPRFHALALTFVASERRHMRWEEAQFFPVAEQRLSQRDWRDIEARFALLHDPMDTRETHMRFHLLVRNDVERAAA